MVREFLVSSRFRNGHGEVSITAALWHNAVKRQIMTQGAFEVCGRDDA